MHFKTWWPGEYEPGETYHGWDACWVYTNALGCIMNPGVESSRALLEVRLEGGLISCVGGGVTGKGMTVVTAEWTGIYVREDGIQLWVRNGQLHREEGPAAVWPNGTQRWFLNGVRVN